MAQGASSQSWSKMSFCHWVSKLKCTISESYWSNFYLWICNIWSICALQAGQAGSVLPLADGECTQHPWSWPAPEGTLHSQQWQRTSAGSHFYPSRVENNLAHRLISGRLLSWDLSPTPCRTWVPLRPGMCRDAAAIAGSCQLRGSGQSLIHWALPGLTHPAAEQSLSSCQLQLPQSPAWSPGERWEQFLLTMGTAQTLKSTAQGPAVTGPAVTEPAVTEPAVTETSLGASGASTAHRDTLHNWPATENQSLLWGHGMLLF